MPREEWLAALAIEQNFVLLHDSGSSLFGRAFELINKTKQFNTTGRRWTRAEMENFFQDGGVCVLASLKDKTMDNGIIGSALVKNGEIVQTVQSCRVFGLGAEIALGRIATQIALTQATLAIGRIVDTGKNFSCHKYYESLGFESQGDHFASRHACAAPDWIRLVKQEVG